MANPNPNRSGLLPPFKPGDARINRNGRPRKVAAVVKAAREHTEEAIKVLAENLKSTDARARNTAAMALLDRGWGKPSVPELAEGSNALAVLAAALTGEPLPDDDDDDDDDVVDVEPTTS